MKMARSFKEKEVNVGHILSDDVKCLLEKVGGGTGGGIGIFHVCPICKQEDARGMEGAGHEQEGAVLLFVALLR